MKKSVTVMVSTLVMMSFLGAVVFGNTASDFESKIDKLEKENSNLEKENLDLQNMIDEQNETVAEQNAIISQHVETSELLATQLSLSEENISQLQSELLAAQVYRDSILLMLADSNDTNSDLENDLSMAEIYSQFVQTQLDTAIANSAQLSEQLNSSNHAILAMLGWPMQDHLQQEDVNDFLNKLLSIDWNHRNIAPIQLRHVCNQNTGMLIGQPDDTSGGLMPPTVSWVASQSCAHELNETYANSGLPYTWNEGDELKYSVTGGENFDSYDMDHFNLSEVELQNVKISLSSISNVNLSNANLTGARITSDAIIDTNFDGADLSNAVLVGDLTGSTFSNADLDGATIASFGDCANISEIDWYCISGHSFGPNSGYAENWDFSYSNFSGMNLTGAEIINANFVNADLTNIVMLEGTLTGDVSGANLTGAWIGGIDLTGITGSNVICPTGGLAEIFVDCMEGNLIGPFTELYDDDLDGFNEMEGDCDDNDPTAYPNATEVHDYRDNDCDGMTDEDIDYDGYTIFEGDCDDNDSSINPGVTELYDGIDNNCDGQVDEGFQIYYRDADGDTHGNPADTTMASSQPSGYVLDATDCDDSDSNTYPGATEVYDGIDNNCDGQIDEGFSLYYRDSDGDGFGDPSVTVYATSQPVGYVPGANDCDDGNSNVNPSATEDPTNGIDDDCDGSVDEP